MGSCSCAVHQHAGSAHVQEVTYKLCRSLQVAEKLPVGAAEQVDVQVEVPGYIKARREQKKWNGPETGETNCCRRLGLHLDPMNCLPEAMEKLNKQQPASIGLTKPDLRGSLMDISITC